MADTMTLEELRESLDVGCLPNTDRPRWFAAIDAAIRERDRLRGDVSGMTEELLRVPSREEWCELQKRAEHAEAELAALKARIAGSDAAECRLDRPVGRHPSILPCPFCGHTPQDWRDFLHPTGAGWRDDNGLRHYMRRDDPRGTHGEVWEIGCLEHEGGCGATMHGDSRDDALAKWNSRAPPNTQVERQP